MEYTDIVASYNSKFSDNDNIIVIENMDEYVYEIYKRIINKDYPTKDQIKKVKDIGGVFVYNDTKDDYIDFINFLDFIGLNDEYYKALIKEDYMRDFMYNETHNEYKDPYYGLNKIGKDEWGKNKHS